jgi:hypothetical protein
MPPPVDIDLAEIPQVIAVLTKIRKAVNNAALVDRTVRDDPMARYYACLMDLLAPDCAVNSEQGYFDRLVLAAVREKARLSTEITSDETPSFGDDDELPQVA